MNEALKKRVDALLERIQGDWSPEDLELAKSVAADWTALKSRQIAGEENLEDEIAEVEAQAANITAGTYSNLATELGRQAKKVIQGLLKSAGVPLIPLADAQDIGDVGIEGKEA